MAKTLNGPAGPSDGDAGPVGAPAPEEDDTALIFGPGHQAVINEASAALAAGRGFPVTLADALPSLALVDRAYACANQDASGE